MAIRPDHPRRLIETAFGKSQVCKKNREKDKSSKQEQRKKTYLLTDCHVD